eukprot:m.4143 g.4143  ORF g.4143 m.4143 type:complete len:877 (-) comp2905_c0_seq2:400-3030(-)
MKRWSLTSRKSKKSESFSQEDFGDVTIDGLEDDISIASGYLYTFPSTKDTRSNLHGETRPKSQAPSEGRDSTYSGFSVSVDDRHHKLRHEQHKHREEDFEEERVSGFHEDFADNDTDNDSAAVPYAIMTPVFKTPQTPSYHENQNVSNTASRNGMYRSANDTVIVYSHTNSREPSIRDSSLSEVIEGFGELNDECSGEPLDDVQDDIKPRIILQRSVSDIFGDSDEENGSSSTPIIAHSLVYDDDANISETCSKDSSYTARDERVTSEEVESHNVEATREEVNLASDVTSPYNLNLTTVGRPRMPTPDDIVEAEAVYRHIQYDEATATPSESTRLEYSSIVDEDGELGFGNEVSEDEEEDDYDETESLKVLQTYTSRRDAILQGKHLVPLEEAVQLAALQIQIEFGSFVKQGMFDMREVLPEEYFQKKDVEKGVFQYHTKEIQQLTDNEARERYIALCKKSPTYGVIHFNVEEIIKGKMRTYPKILGVSPENVVTIDIKTKRIMDRVPIVNVRRWRAFENLFALDVASVSGETGRRGSISGVGDMVQLTYETKEGNKISKVLAMVLNLKKNKDTPTNSRNPLMSSISNTKSSGSRKGSSHHSKEKDRSIHIPAAEQAIIRTGSQKTLFGPKIHNADNFTLPNFTNMSVNVKDLDNSPTESSAGQTATLRRSAFEEDEEHTTQQVQQGGAWMYTHLVGAIKDTRQASQASVLALGTLDDVIIPTDDPARVELRAKVAKHTERHITTLMHACDALVDLTSMSSDTGNGCNDVDFGTAGTWVRTIKQHVTAFTRNIKILALLEYTLEDLDGNTQGQSHKLMTQAKTISSSLGTILKGFQTLLRPSSGTGELVAGSTTEIMSAAHTFETQSKLLMQSLPM